MNKTSEVCALIDFEKENDHKVHASTFGFGFGLVLRLYVWVLLCFERQKGAHINLMFKTRISNFQHVYNSCIVQCESKLSQTDATLLRGCAKCIVNDIPFDHILKSNVFPNHTTSSLYSIPEKKNYQIYPIFLSSSQYIPHQKISNCNLSS